MHYFHVTSYAHVGFGTFKRSSISSFRPSQIHRRNEVTPGLLIPALPSEAEILHRRLGSETLSTVLRSADTTDFTSVSAWYTCKSAEHMYSFNMPIVVGVETHGIVRGNPFPESHYSLVVHRATILAACEYVSLHFSGLRTSQTMLHRSLPVAFTFYMRVLPNPVAYTKRRQPRTSRLRLDCAAATRLLAQRRSWIFYLLHVLLNPFWSWPRLR